MAQILLHGTLLVSIFEASSLPAPYGSSPQVNKSQILSRQWFIRKLSWIKKLRLCCPQLLEGVEERKGTAKLYATVDLQKARVGRTRLVSGEPVNPRWYETFSISCAHTVTDIVFTIKLDNPVGAALIGRAYLDAHLVLGGRAVERWLPVCNEDRQPVDGGAMLRVKVEYIDVSHSGGGELRAFFPRREACAVTLYQDAHIGNGRPPQITLADGRMYQAGRCWEDMLHAITNARQLIYITGWSVNTEITLVRDPDLRRVRLTLGEVLKKKAGEGVRVLMLVWDDRTSVPLLKKDGVMATHDQETADYFKGSDVHCVLCPRDPDGASSYVQDLQIATLFTHHQKTLMVDGDVSRQGGAYRRRIVSFLGGIDLCDGRYDTQSHSLFRTLNTAHYNDFHQPCFPGASIKKGGPREPWHDVHCRLEGAVAWDVLRNFEQRWRKQAPEKSQPLLLQIPDLGSSNFIPPSPAITAGGEGWNVRIFRSIDGGAASGFPESPQLAAESGLTTGKDHVLERSIQDAYIQAIRRAKKFIYIENQYFIGSSYGWRERDGVKVEDVEAIHTVPKELALKVANKIEAGERFVVYVVIPMWPEGVPDSASVQAMLDWQRRTMEMMYGDVAVAMKAKGIQGNPREFISFFCLGNREAKRIGDGEYISELHPEPDTDYQRAQEARRFMIYVHAKMMIVDDEYIIVGSANINQRSMDGGRDTEIAMGAYQHGHLSTKWDPARGQVHGFRMALWHEHLGTLDRAFLEPESIECVRKVNRMAEENWDMYAGEAAGRDLPGHLLRYPVRITADGEVEEMPGVPFFPDTKARVLGTKSDLLPPILTT